MIEKNDEAMRSKIWRIATIVSSVLIVLIAIFLLTKLFTTNPVEGSWVNEDGSLELKFQGSGEVTAVRWIRTIRIFPFRMMRKS